MNKAETQRGRAHEKWDIAGFESRPAFSNILWDSVSPWLLIPCLFSGIFGLLYMMQGATFIGTILLVVCAVIGKVINEA